MNVVCYSQCRFNPFRGVMNIIRIRSAEALTTDGIHWEIFDSNGELRVELGAHARTENIRYWH